MLRTPPRFLVVTLASTLLLLAALPAVAAPRQAASFSWLSWVGDWLATTWSPPSSTNRAAATDETVPSLDPNGIEGSPKLSSPPAGPDGSGTTTSDGETVPSLDPDG